MCRIVIKCRRCLLAGLVGKGGGQRELQMHHTHTAQHTWRRPCCLVTTTQNTHGANDTFEMHQDVSKHTLCSMQVVLCRDSNSMALVSTCMHALLPHTWCAAPSNHCRQCGACRHGAINSIAIGAVHSAAQPAHPTKCHRVQIRHTHAHSRARTPRMADTVARCFPHTCGLTHAGEHALCAVMETNVPVGCGRNIEQIACAACLASTTPKGITAGSSTMIMISTTHALPFQKETRLLPLERCIDR